MKHTYTIASVNSPTETFTSRREMVSECSSWADIEDALYEIWRELETTRGYESCHDMEFICDYFEEAITDCGYTLTKITGA